MRYYFKDENGLIYSDYKEGTIPISIEEFDAEVSVNEEQDPIEALLAGDTVVIK